MKLSDFIIQTFRYSDRFDYPLTLAELHTRLIKTKVSPAQLKAELKQLVDSKKIGQQDDHYYLRGHSKLVKTRQEREKIASHKHKLARHYANYLSYIPGVRALYITGSLAVNNTRKDDDIDFMVITESGKLWTTRLLLTVATELLGIRRRPKSQNNNNKLCLNLYLTPQSYALPTNRRSLYTAYELIQALPLYDPHNTRDQLLTTNSWINNNLPNYPLPKKMSPKVVNQKTGILENFTYWLQRHYMSKRLTGEHITKDSAFFHPRSTNSGVK